jgi:D-arabinose 1-dehydrogenase-like Zn-dependent alcohol dehydrogenase
MTPSNQKQWIVQDKEHGIDGLVYKEGPVPKVGENEVLVKLHAASLNYRDLIIPRVSVKVEKFLVPEPANQGLRILISCHFRFIGTISISSRSPSGPRI